DAQPSVLAAGRDLDSPTFHHSRDAMFDCVLDQRMQEKRRHDTPVATRIGLERSAEPRAETNLLDIQIRTRQGKFLLEGDARLVAEIERAAQKIGKLNAHFARARTVDSRQRADRI